MSRAGRSPRSRPQNPKEGGNLSNSNQPDGGGVGRGVGEGVFRGVGLDPRVSAGS